MNKENCYLMHLIVSSLYLIWLKLNFQPNYITFFEFGTKAHSKTLLNKTKCRIEKKWLVRLQLYLLNISYPYQIYKSNYVWLLLDVINFHSC